MPGEPRNSATISKNNAGFPPYLDFNKLRTEGINYLGKLSGKIWSDHNLHDPGITTLEVLCYAMMDLGYRINLPVEDILARNPAATGPEDNFFTPAQILTNNPLTINDYRKLLVDIPGIRNAWLEPARDIRDLCKKAEPREDIGTPGRNIETPNRGRSAERNIEEVFVATHPTDTPIPAQVITPCEEFLNGIYHVFIETELDLDKDFKNDDPNIEESDKQKFIQQITGEVRKVLMAHRNLCEDFADIYILCKLETGVCATVELEEGADEEEVYVEIANRLHEYFSATPKFYTLDQMLEKGRTMDEIFAGRPLSVFSHGFIDTAELEASTLKREIHTSDIYHTIFDVKGVRRISRLKFRNCGKPCISIDGKKDTEWTIHLPQNHIPDFTLSCSGIEFTRNGLPISIDLDNLNTQIELGWLHNGKIRYKMPSPYLDAEIPRGKYLADLSDYLSVQNELPSVYGIREGEIPDDAPVLRKAQALQLKGYLLFFDQMLANYLTQLQNIRQLFSFEHPFDPKFQHTYFLNTISSIPEMDKLLKFGGNSLGPAGTILGIPVNKNTWDTANFAAQPAGTILAGFSSFTFSSLYGVYEATDLLRNDLVNEGESQIEIKIAADGKFLYALVTSTDDFVLVGQKDFGSLEDAEKHASSIQYAGVFEKNYRSFITAANDFTFDLELTLDIYTDYLGIIVENESLYLRRRKDFLSHLLARFAEQFTDFVIYNWKSAMGVSDIYAAEQYLTQYPDLSRNRGRAYNYLLDGFINDNISGFEKKVKAIAGIYSGKKNYLCHFVVEPFDETYFFDFNAKISFSSLTNISGAGSAGSINHESHGFVYRLVDKNNIPAVFSVSFADKASASGKKILLAEITKKLVEKLPGLQIDPIKEIRDNSIEFAQLFCRDYVKPAPDEEGDIKYYFDLEVDDDIKGHWFSTEYFETREEALQAFDVFRMLVGYAGNYYVDCACTGLADKDQVIRSFSYKIFLREVLAQGIDIFETIEDAWGPKGIEKFICAVQAGDTIWEYQRHKECYSFYITCGAGTLIHPCNYDSEKTRTKAISVLLEQGVEFIEKQSYGYSASNGTMNDSDGKAFARVNLERIKNAELCDLFITIAEQLANKKGETIYLQNGYLQLVLQPSGIVLQSTEKRPELSDEEVRAWIELWEKMLQLWACFFPIIRTRLDQEKGQPARYKYCIEIKLPGFNDCYEQRDNQLYIAEARSLQVKSLCYVAWKFPCCFYSCNEAKSALEAAWKQISDKKNYRPVFDCEEGTFGIALHSLNPSLIGQNQKPPKPSDIIAINPQCYPASDAVCKAVEKTIKLVNVQGMHLIEHILLRPFKKEDCRCREKLAACGLDCDFPHWIMEDPACNSHKIHVCFKPGSDPYSFIATIILPSWSKRFRDEKERALFEQLLYREAPSHVLLRVLWLRPLDFCRLESMFSDWEIWMAGAFACNRDFSLCRFIDLLFSTYYDCLPGCVDCLPCREPEQVKPGCWDNERDGLIRTPGFVDQINELFCFEDYCRRRDQRPKEESKEESKGEPRKKPSRTKSRPTDARSIRETSTRKKKKD